MAARGRKAKTSAAETPVEIDDVAEPDAPEEFDAVPEPEVDEAPVTVVTVVAPPARQTIRIQLLEDMMGSRKGDILEVDCTNWAWLEKLHRQQAIHYLF